jgi:hypothetical protein
MSRTKTSADLTFGFLSTLESADYGHFGGYLIVSTIGRPLEFHCTAPVRASRAQEILYGPTLQPYLIGELISGALLKAAKACPCLILVDTDTVLVARSLVNCPMAFVAQRLSVEAEPLLAHGEGTQPYVGHASSSDLHRLRNSGAHLEAGGYGLVLPRGFEGDLHAVSELAAQLSQRVDLAEPFGRIHEAIREAQRIGGRSGEVHGKAA